MLKKVNTKILDSWISRIAAIITIITFFAAGTFIIQVSNGDNSDNITVIH